LWCELDQSVVNHSIDEWMISISSRTLVLQCSYFVY